MPMLVRRMEGELGPDQAERSAAASVRYYRLLLIVSFDGTAPSRAAAQFVF
jgi:hypothetical protein